jgi:hypothetical protein
MQKTLSLILLAGMILFIVTPAKAEVVLLDKDGWKATFTGFAELDAIGDTTRSVVESPGNGPIDRPGGPNGDDGRTMFSMRNSRLGFGVTAPASGDWVTKGYIETDFLGFDPKPDSTGINTEGSYFASPTLRIRHAYLQADNGPWTILAGQWWSQLGFQPIYVLPSAAVNPVSGTMYDRTPQLFVQYKFDFGSENALQAFLSAERPPQRDAQLPAFDAGLRFSMGGHRAAWSAATSGVSTMPASIAVSGSARQFVSPTPGGAASDQTHYVGAAGAADIFIPVIMSSDEKDTSNTLALMGEFTMGQGYADEFPGWTGNLASPLQSAKSAPSNTVNLDAGQGDFNPSTGAFQIVDLMSFNLSAQYHLPGDCHTFVSVGYGQLFSDNVDSLANPATGFASSGKVPYDRQSSLFVNVFHDFTKNVRAAVEVSQYRTEYADSTYARDDRVQLSTWFRF